MTRRLPFVILAAILALAVLRPPRIGARVFPLFESGQTVQPLDAAEFPLSSLFRRVTSLAVERRGNLVVAGVAGGEDFPTTHDAADRSCREDRAAVQVLSPDGDLLYGTCLGSDPLTDYELVDVAPARDGSIWIHVRKALWRIKPGVAGYRDAFRFDAPVGQCGSTQSGIGKGLAVSPDGSVWVAGAVSARLPPVNAWQPTMVTAPSLFIARFVPGDTGPSLLTYLGGPGGSSCRALAAAPDGDAVVVGWAGLGFPLVRPFLQRPDGQYDLVLARLDASGRLLEYSTYLGGSGSEPSVTVAVNRSGDACVIGRAHSSVYPATGASVARNPAQDVFMIAVDRAGALTQAAIIDPGLQYQIPPNEYLVLCSASLREDGSLVVAQSFLQRGGLWNRHYGGGAIVSFIDRFGAPIRRPEVIDLASRHSWRIEAVASGGEYVYAVGVLWSEPESQPGGWVVKRVRIGRVDRAGAGPGGAVDRR